MNMKIYNRLVTLAREDQLTTYSDIAPLADLTMDDAAHREEMSRLLEEIARCEQAAKRPMLTAIVVHQGGDNNPGEGFFAIAAEFGRFTRTRNQNRRAEFWVSQVAEVYNYW